MSKVEKATFGAGCFWGVEELFRPLDGVEETQVGYTDGHKERPSYEEVCSGSTGHVEAVEITFDPELISFERLLDVFWSGHDPSTLNRQGPDVGTQYRSGIYVHSEEQRKTAEESLAKRQETLGGKKIVTEIKEATTFWSAEEYHQKYLAKKGLSSCPL